MNPTIWTAIVLFLIVEVFSLLPPRWTPAPKQPTPLPFLTGVAHLHTIFSGEGGGSPKHIVEAARQAGIDFVIITDLDTTRARREGFEGTFEGIDLFVEMEVATPAGHVLAFYSHTGSRNLPDKDIAEMAWRHYQSGETRDGIFLTVSHPSHVKLPWNRLDRYPEGIELINFDAVWQRAFSDSFLDFSLTAAILAFNPYLAALRFYEPYPKDLVAWDNMNALSHGHFAILGHDTQEKLHLTREWSLEWPTYHDAFRVAANVVLLSEPPPEKFEDRREVIYRAIREGRLAIVFQAIHPFEGNGWQLRCGDNSYRSGDDAPLKDGCEFVVDTPPELPYRKIVRLWKDGELSAETTSPESRVSFPARAPGMYRVEVLAAPTTLFRALLRRPTPYVIYNPIYVR